MKPRLFSFDIFGTVVDWRRGLEADLTRLGRALAPGDFDRIVDAQGRDEQAEFRPYREITARSLISVLGLDPAEAAHIGSQLGHWPAFTDAPAGLSSLLELAPCVATTNSDLQHASAVQRGLGVSLSHWICAEELGLYKPAPEFWQAVSRRLGVALSPAWWHVSAYADYDLDVALALGLTTVLVTRPHRRPGSAHFTVRDLNELAELAAEVE